MISTLNKNMFNNDRKTSLNESTVNLNKYLTTSGLPEL